MTWFGNNHRAQYRYLAALCVLFSALSWSQCALAKNTIRPTIYPLIAKIQNALSTFDHTKTTEKKALSDQIQRLLESNPNAFEEALGHQFSGQLSLISEDYSAAYTSFSKASKLKVLDPILQSDIEHTLAQLAVQTEQWQVAVNHFNQWFNRLKALQKKNQPVKKVKDQDYMMLAQAHFQLEQWSLTIKAIDQALSLYNKANPTSVALESWYRFKLAALMNLSQSKPSRKTTNTIIQSLKWLLLHYPSESYWRQLASIYQQQGADAKTQSVTDRYYGLALSTLHASFQSGLLTAESDLLWMVRLMMQQGSYHQAARVLENLMADGLIQRSVETLTLLQDAWVMSRDYEKAERTLQTLLGLEPNNEKLKLRLESVQQLRSARH